jgi:hypothetical protein
MSMRLCHRFLLDRDGCAKTSSLRVIASHTQTGRLNKIVEENTVKNHREHQRLICVMAQYLTGDIRREMCGRDTQKKTAQRSSDDRCVGMGAHSISPGKRE